MSSKQERDYEINEPPHKRRKLNIIQQNDQESDDFLSSDSTISLPSSTEEFIPKIACKFSGTDQTQFILLFRTIQSCDLIKTLYIPTIINSEIAQYATGEVFNCLNTKCTNKIIKLDEDHHNGICMSSKYYYNDYCLDCSKYTTFCDTCDELILLLEGRKCSWCNEME
eukprot:293255_1